MGMYSHLDVKVIVKEEYRQEIKYLFENELYWCKSNVDFLKEFSNHPDCGVIGNQNNNYNEYTGELIFITYVKDYKGVIRTFVENVLIHICSDVLLFEFLSPWYEYDDGEERIFNFKEYKENFLDIT